MPIAMSSKVSSHYILEAEREQSKPTRFTLRPLTSVQMMKAQESGRHAFMAPDGNVAIDVRMDSLFIALVEEALIGWVDFYDAQGQPARFRRGDLSALSSDAIREIGKEVWERNNLSEPEVKN